ncbi:hypothetical protein BO71DRAFT_199240 [Aspergillus ellipticus CBS 707.79]|uniref:Uncharacterized protein n=1 Tax=Aspergillus ellipticus CBS 707.79 TaxID=1448320 RepID=A0A319DE95_9EURO|nr:hypothetical protein BO71DRAFT_199240 [Aspergillus ellipticus CBS 707.79]
MFDSCWQPLYLSQRAFLASSHVGRMDADGIRQRVRDTPLRGHVFVAMIIPDRGLGPNSRRENDDLLPNMKHHLKNSEYDSLDPSTTDITNRNSDKRVSCVFQRGLVRTTLDPFSSCCQTHFFNCPNPFPPANTSSAQLGWRLRRELDFRLAWCP